MKNFILFTSCLFLAQLTTYAQTTNRQFDLIKYKGEIGQYPITMFLTFYPDKHCAGYYYYDNVGQLLKVEKVDKTNILESYPIEQYPTKKQMQEEKEFFQFVDSISLSKTQLTGTWTKGNRRLQFTLHKAPSQMEWKYFSGIRQGVCDDYFHTSEEKVNFIYPSIQSSKNLNECILSKFLNDRALIQYLNLTESHYTVIRENFEQFCIGYWVTYFAGEVVFYTDSILTYRIKGSTYANNGDTGDYMLSIKKSSGTILSHKDIFKANDFDTVLSLMRNKYKRLILEETDEYNTIDRISVFSNIYIAPNGIYFNDRSYNLAPFVHLFMSFKELEPYLNENFKDLIK